MAIFNVSNQSQLMSALQNASGGDEIRLASGDYGDLNLSGTSFNSAVTITSANGSNPASFSGMSLENVSNLTFDNVVFDYEFNGEPRPTYRPFLVDNSENITIQNSLFEGDVAQGISPQDDGLGYSIGLRVEQSTGITIDNNEFTNLYHGAQYFEVEDLVVTNNEVHNLRSDGMNFIEVQGVLVEGNYFHDFIGSPTSGDHRDFIQFWKNNTDEPTTDVVIRDNRLDVGDGSFTQSIFFGDSGRTDRDLYFQNILIEGNEIFAAQHHGISVGLADGVVIRDNIVVPVDENPDAPGNAGRSGGVTIPKINVSDGSLNVTIEDNQTAQITGYEGQRDWTVSGNVILQDENPNAPGYIPDLLELRDETITVSPPSPDPEPEVTPEPEEEPVSAEPPAPEPEQPSGETGTTPGGSQSGSIEEIDDFVLDIAALSSSDLQGDAEVVNTANGPAVRFDGNKDFVSLGRQEQFEASDELTFSVEFSRDVADGEDARLVWNHQKIGLGIEDDGIYVRVGIDGERWQTFRSDDIGLNDTDLHRATVIVDDNSDRLQVIVDDQVVIDESGFDFEINGNGGREWGWSLGTKWGRFLDGDINDFRIEADANFDHNYVPLSSDFLA